MSQANGLLEAALVFVGILVGVAISYVGMMYSSRISKLIGTEGLRVVTKIMAVIVLAIAVQFLINGITGVIPTIIHP